MGRETTILLAALGVLGGAFVGVLSMKLLVPRPPAGAGPDVDPQEAVVARQDLVEPPALEPPPAARPRRDPFVTRSAFAAPPEHHEALTVGNLVVAPPTPTPVSASPVAPAPIAGAHVTIPGDTWWSIAERAYGDGRLYRALFAWNRRLAPQVSTAPGTRLDVPPRERLAAAWPNLMP